MAWVDWCEAADPEPKGVVEHLVGYAETDLVVPGCDGPESLTVAMSRWPGDATRSTPGVHTEVAAVPAARPADEVNVLRPLLSLRAQVERGQARKVDRLSRCGPDPRGTRCPPGWSANTFGPALPAITC